MFVLAAFAVLASAMVFGRVIVDRFDKARGMALAVGMSASPLISAALLPAIDYVIETEGWRTAYRVLALLSAAGGLVAILLIGERGPARGRLARLKPAPLPRAELIALIRKPAFILLISGMIMLSLPTVMMASQIKLVLEESGASSQFATWLVSLSAASVVAGRLVCGYALDRAPIHIVSFISLLLPAIGFFAIASPYDQSWVLLCSIVVVGMATGAESDIGAMVISKKFDNRHYSLVYSCLAASVGFSAALGAIILSLTLSRTNTYDVFLFIAGGFTLAGAVGFYLLGKTQDHVPAKSEEVADVIAEAVREPSGSVVIGG
jgi:predicted MFS family arabinose efflux permease